MKTTAEKINIMTEIEKLVKEWLDYTKGLGNECAYTDSIIELIHQKACELDR